jgi:Peptidase family M23
MSWQEIMRRILSPVGDASPEVRSPYGDTNRPRGSTNPHRGVDFTYRGSGFAKLNQSNPAIRLPVAGIVTNAGGGNYGTIAIRDANGFSHEILHTHARHVAVGDPVAAGQLIGTMGNTGVDKPKIESGANHVHYQIKDPSGNVINPSAFWDQQGPVDPNPAPPAYLDEHRRYLRGLDVTLENAFGNVPNAGPIYGAQPAGQPEPLIASRQSSDDLKKIRVLGRQIADQPLSPRFNANAAAVQPNELLPADRPASFSDRFGNWAPFDGVSAPLSPYQALSPPPQTARPLGLISGQPMSDYPFPPPIFGVSDFSGPPGQEDWSAQRRKSADWKGRGS